MKRDSAAFPRARPFGADGPARDRAAGAAHGGPRVVRACPRHLVLANGAAGRAGVLLGVAARLAEAAGASVRVAVLRAPPPPGDLENVRRLSPTCHGVPEAEARDDLARAARSVAARTGLPVTPELLAGPADPTLTEFVRANDFDLVSAAAGGTWRPLWAGGPWYEVARRRPVLVVGPGVDPTWHAGPRAAGGVLVVLDGAAPSEPALAPAVSLCRLLDARLTLLGVVPAGRAGQAGKHLHRYLVDVGRLARRHVAAVRTVVATGRPAEAVLNVQRATGAVVSVAAPARSWLAARTPGRFGVRVIRRSSAPVLFHRPTM